MYNGIGLSTPRGSGTNGYVQKNLAFISNFKEQQPYKSASDIGKADAILFKEPNKEILEHERKRKIEVKCFEMQEEMEEQGYTESEIERKVSLYRSELINAMKAENTDKTVPTKPIINPENGRLVSQGTHEDAALTMIKNDVFKQALGIGAEFQDGNSMELMNQRRKEDEETKKLVEVQKSMQTIESDEESEHSSPPREKKSKKKRRHRSPSSESDRSDSDSGHHKRRSHKKSRKHKHRHSHSKKKRHD